MAVSNDRQEQFEEGQGALFCKKTKAPLKKPEQPDFSVLILAECSRADLLKFSTKSCIHGGVISFGIVDTIFSFELKHPKLLLPYPL